MTSTYVNQETGQPLPAVTPERLADILESAALTLERDGWCQDNLTLDGKKCARGALCDAIGLTEAQSGPVWAHLRRALTHAELALARHLTAEGGRNEGPIVDIPGWNDTPGRTAEDVITAMRKTAITLREKVQP